MVQSRMPETYIDHITLNGKLINGEKYMTHIIIKQVDLKVAYKNNMVVR